MKREIKFRGFIDELDIMMDKVTVYASGIIGFDDEEFRKQLPKDHELIDDGVYHTTENDFDLIIGVLPGEDWIWLDSGFTIMQYTGLKDKNGKEIYEGDILEWEDFADDEYWAKYKVVIPDIFYTLEHLADFKTEEDVEIIGNIYEHPELIKQSNEA